MHIQASDYEKLGSFYLGRAHDLKQNKLKDELVLYDSKDLVTHGVVLGMTGSGKTGLCISILEEAAMDNIPAIIIDPKGDISNLMLNFPNFEPSDFRPWINEDDAAKKGKTPDEFAEKNRQHVEGWYCLMGAKPRKSPGITRQSGYQHIHTWQQSRHPSIHFKLSGSSSFRGAR